MLEVEIKRSLDDHACDALRMKLDFTGFTKENELHEIDTYYSRPDVDFIKTVECLRVRTRENFCEMTYKPATLEHKKSAEIIAKQETNVGLKENQATLANQFMENIGMVRQAVVDKRRQVYKNSDIPDLTITIDTVMRVGTFVEIEVMSNIKKEAIKTIKSVEKLLELSHLPTVTKPYRDLVMEKQR